MGSSLLSGGYEPCPLTLVFYDSQNLRRSRNSEARSNYSSDPYKRAGPNKRAGWNFDNI